MPDMVNINVRDLHDVKKGKGYYVGKLNEQHKIFKYLKANALVFNTDSVQATFRVFSELGWKPAREKSSNTNKSSNRDFYFFEDLQEAISVYTKNPKQVRSFKEEDIKLTAEENVGKDIQYGVTGDYVDIGRFLDGEPECFGIAYNGNPAGLQATLLFNVSTPWYVNEDLLNHRAARMLRLVDWMESQGVRCQVRAIESTECAHMDIRVKSFEDAVDMNALAVATHSDFLRRIAFLVAEQSPTYEAGYGNATVYTRDMMSSYKADPDNGLTIFITEVGRVEIADIDSQFDLLRDKITDLLSSPQNRDFSKVYAVELKG
jgi:hypothetical protein